jgi:hypothetical protein
MNRIWLLRNNVYHETDQGRITQYKKEELTRWMEKIWGRHSDLQGQLQEFKHTHSGKREVTITFDTTHSNAGRC